MAQQTIIEKEVWQTLSDGAMKVSLLKNTPIWINSSGMEVTFTYETVVKLTTSKSHAFEVITEEEEDVIELRVIPEKEARQFIIDYLNNHPKAWTSDIAYDLHLDVDLVLKILQDLEKEGLVE